MTIYRPARIDDALEIAKVHRAAFGGEDEVKLVGMLEACGDVAASIVAEEDNRVVGHVMLSRMEAEADGTTIEALALAPVAVLPERQGVGIGGALVRTAEATARQLGCQAIFLLGEPGYYGRFDYDVGAARPFESPYAGDYWQVLLIDGGLRETRAGKAKHARAFAALG
ncbi:MAG: N-acetyltransferase [Sphingomonas sp.]|nr:N-acetyltransferase [Sphingomonas sp.]RZV52241.1 MAG: N-acetyltransferase [Sphingomonadaceae bacterium]